MKQLNFQGLVQLGVAEDATTPNPGFAGALIWSTTTASIMVWNGSNWKSTQTLLVSGTSIKTVNGTSLLGSGNIAISGGGGGSSPILSWMI